VTETVTRLRATTSTGRYGDPDRDWANPAELAITGCVVAPRDPQEDRENGREAVIVGFNVYAPAGTSVLATDRLRVRGQDQIVDGETGVWTNPWSEVTEGVEIRTRVVNG
jgi:hypothetical protein